MKFSHGFERHKQEYLDLTSKDKEILETLHELWTSQRRAIQEDYEFINNITINTDDLNSIIDSAYDSTGITYKLINNRLQTVDLTPEERGEVIQNRKKVTDSNTEHTEYYKTIVSSLCDVSGFNTQEVMDDVLEKGILYDVGRSFERYIRQKSEPNAREILKRLEREAFEKCDKCFTTSQEGSGTANNKTKNDAKYDSIYFLYTLSNGTYISQRFKRNIILQAPLDDVINPFLDLALFIGKGVDPTLSRIQPGFYKDTAISTMPVVGMDLIEYYTDEFKNNVARGSLGEAKIPDVVQVVEGGVVLSDNFNKLFQHDHEGTAVNLILK